VHRPGDALGLAGGEQVQQGTAQHGEQQGAPGLRGSAIRSAIRSAVLAAVGGGARAAAWRPASQSVTVSRPKSAHGPGSPSRDRA
jgi:hypothetical protein